MTTTELAATGATPGAGTREIRANPIRRLLRNPMGVASLAVLIIITIVGLIAPLIEPFDPNVSSLTHVNAAPGVDGYILGGDLSGRDILSRLLASIKVSIMSAVVGTVIAVVVGVAFGLIAGYRGKRFDDVTSWISNLIMTFPALVLLIVLFPATGGVYFTSMAIFGLLLAPGVFRLVRSLVTGVRQELYVDAARVFGLSDGRILSRHILFVVRGPIIITAAFLAGTCINFQAGLAFLGLGTSGTPSWGAMVQEGFTNFYSAPYQFLWPAIMLGITTTAFVLLGNAFRDVLEDRRPVVAKKRRSRVSSAESALQAAPVSQSTGSLLEVRDLCIAYPSVDGHLKTVIDSVNLTIAPSEILGLVGESGSGKTQTAFAILRVLPGEAVITRGAVLLDGRDLSTMSPKQLRRMRGSEIAYVPQEPMSNLDPSYTVGHQLTQGIRASKRVSRREAKVQVLALLERVGIADAVRVFGLYPHQISGGMAQRVLIAGAVASSPKLLIADEPTTAVDVTVQAEILDLLRDLQRELQMAMLLVTHNFGVVADLCDRVAVMRNGSIVETAGTVELFEHPEAEYTRSLLSSILSESELRSPRPDNASIRIGAAHE